MRSAFQIMLEDNINKCVSFPKLKYRLTFILNGMNIQAVNVSDLVIIEDYITNLFTTGFIEVTVEPSVYHTVLQYARSNIQLKLDTFVSSGSGVVRTDYYYGFLLDTSNPQLDSNVAALQDIDRMDATSLMSISLQIIEPSCYYLMGNEIDGCMFNNATASDVYKYILSQQMLREDFSSDKAIGSITFDSETVNTTYSVIEIEDGTPFVNIGDELQRIYGIYNQGFGVFLKNLQWQIFAPYNLKKDITNVERLVIINAPKNRYKNTEATYFREGNTHTIIATGDTRSSNLVNDTVNSGVGSRFADPNKLVDGFSKGSVDRPKLDPKDYMTEYQGVHYNNPVKHTVSATNMFESNPSVVSSKLAASGGYIITVEWDHGMIEPLIPGMPVKYIFEANRNLQQWRGTLIGASMVSAPNGSTLVDAHFNNIVKLTLFVKEVV